MARHTFSFPNGDTLTTMGATWFVSYAFHLYADNTHTNWNQVSTYKNRANVFSSSKQHHRFFLSKILEMDENNLNKNTLGLSGIEVKKMAEVLLQKIK